MEVWHWITQHWLELLQSAGIIGGLFFTALSFRVDARVRRIGNLLTLTQHHRDIWTHFYQRAELARVLDESVNLRLAPITDEEAVFLTLLILHLNSAYYAMEEGMFTTPEGLRKDIRWFLALPMPKAVWERIKPFQDVDFVRFVEECLR